MIRPTVVSLLVAALFSGCSGDLREMNRCYALGKALCGAYRIAPTDECVDQVRGACQTANEDSNLDAAEINDCIDAIRETSGDDFDRCVGSPPEACLSPFYEVRNQSSGSSNDGFGSNSCTYSYDGACDEPSLCAPGTDSADCGSSSSSSSSRRYTSGCLEGSSDLQLDDLISECESGRCAGGATEFPTMGNDSCEYARDGECDEPVLCALGTDMTDCI